MAVLCPSRFRRSLSREFTWRRKLSGLGGGDASRKLPRRDEMNAGQASASMGTPETSSSGR